MEGRVSVDLWISVGLAVPLAVAANLVTPRVRTWLDNKAESGALRRRRRGIAEKRRALADTKRMIDEIEGFMSSRWRYHEYLLETVIRATLYGALGTMAGSVAFAIPSLQVSASLGVLLGQMIILLTYTIVGQICWRALRIITRFRNAAGFLDEARKRVAALESELAAAGEM